MPDKNVQMPDGSVVAFPDSMSDDAIAGVLRTQHPAAKTEPEGFWHSLGSSLGITPEAAKQQADDFKEHPSKILTQAALGPAGQMISGAYQGAKRSVGELAQAYDAAKQGNGASAAVHAITAIPVIGPALDKGSDQYAAGNYAGEAGTLTGAAAQIAPLLTDAAVSGAKRVPPPPAAIGDAVGTARQYARPASSPAIVPPEEVQAQKIAQSILPPGGIKPELVKGIQAEAPAIVDYARRTGNPLNTQAEGLKAAQGVAKEGLDHFTNQILGPVASDSINLGAGKTNLGRSATLGQISDAITDLNKKVNTAKASNSGEALMMLEKGGVTDQLAYLRSVLYDGLAKKTGIDPADLQALREGYGGQYSVANSLESAQNARLTRTGQISQGQQNINIKPPSLLELPGKAYQVMRGGEQAVADRQFSSAMRGVQPEAPMRPMPNPPETPTPAIRGLQKWANDGAIKVAGHLADDPSSGLTANDIQRSASDPKMRQLLIKASDLTPGSPAMRNLVQQIKTTLGAAQ